ncbi:hypothetical protein J1605_007416 [Eschrichtius robustus]|uniref:Uncharacterized protein n=1 Tax=Eschrichtius robustus TaxID=9764 RepID=A0AB34GXS7_ESCRO|nr:hypothetical protein J1605_007416 [Eschrichtius robustus]
MQGARAWRCRGLLLTRAAPGLAASRRYARARGPLWRPAPAGPRGQSSRRWSPVPARPPPHPRPRAYLPESAP